MLNVIDAVYLGDYKIALVFNDKKSGVADLHPVIFTDNREPFLMLRHESEFKKFKIEHQTLVWENGLDLAPDTMYHEIKKNPARRYELKRNA